jgi:Tetratricopeptide repeat
MNHQGIRLTIAILLLPGTLAWGDRTRHGDTTSAVAAINNECQEIGRIDRLEGRGLLLREGLPDALTLTPGERLCVGDRVQLAANARASAVCATDGTTRNFPLGMESRTTSVCPPVEECDDSANPGCLRGDDDKILNSNTPHILSPYNTALLTTQPRFRWGAFSAENRYTVTLENGGKTAWGPIEVEGTEVTYSGEIPLVAGTSYKLTVTANNGATVTSRFSLLKEEERTELMQVLAMQPIDETAVIPPQVYVYTDYLLFSEAIDTLEATIANGNRSAAIYLQLGQLYNGIGLLFKAEAAYSEAIEQAVTEGNLKGQALARARLGQVYRDTGNLEAAIAQFSQAKMLYEQAGDPDRAQEVDKLREEVEASFKRDRKYAINRFQSE